MDCPDCGKKMKKITSNFTEDYCYCQDCGYNTHPLYQKIYQKQKFRKVRKELVKALSEEYGYRAITKNEIMDEMIDLGIYNIECKKGKRK